MQHEQGEHRRYHILMPPFVFVGGGTAYAIFAVKQRPQHEYDRLYHASCPNVHHHGGICSGNTPFPACSPQTIEAALSLFMENSLFNGDLSRGKSHRSPDDVRELWAELEGKKRFPLSELVSCRRVSRQANGKMVASLSTESRCSRAYCRVEIDPEIVGVLDTNAES